MSKQAATITEYGAIALAANPRKDKYLSAKVEKKAFEALARFNADNDDVIFTLTRVKSKNSSKVEALKAKSYVGVIETKCGTVVEILPKIYQAESENNKNGIKNTRKIFLKMLKSLRDSPFKEIDTAHLHTEKLSILEIFITLFLQDLEKLIQKGIARIYINIEENQPFLKGKLLFNQNVKYNFLHKERFYVSYDEFITNRPENRLIKSTLDFLAKIARSNNNQKKIREFIFTFDEIPASGDIDKDISKVKKDRLISYYDKVLNWCRVFLRNESFTNFKGKAVSLALLFPMERIFEDYVGAMFKKHCPDDMSISLQDKKHHLIEKHNNQPWFKLRPDIVITKDHEKIILDTKWKLINQNKSKSKSKDNYNISQSDMYQMFAYGEKYKAKRLFLLYPENEYFQEHLKCFKFNKDKDEDMTLYVCPVKLSEDIKRERDSLKCIVELLKDKKTS